MKRSEGYVLVAALVVIALMMAAGALLAGSLQYRMWLLRQQTQDVHLTALADAGMARALDGLSRSHFWSGAPEEPLGDGTVEIRVEMGDRALERVVGITVTYGNAGRSVRAIVVLSDLVPPRVEDWQTVPYSPEGAPIYGL